MKYIVVGKYQYDGSSHIQFEVYGEDAAKNAIALMIKHGIVDTHSVCYFPKAINGTTK